MNPKYTKKYEHRQSCSHIQVKDNKNNSKNTFCIRTQTQPRKSLNPNNKHDIVRNCWAKSI